jgi:quinol monooxygenase YgiN
MPDHARLIRIAKYRANPGVREELLARMEELATAMRDLQGLFGAQVCTINKAPEWLALVSRWQDEEALRQIEGTPAARLVEDIAGLVEQEEIEHLISV